MFPPQNAVVVNVVVERASGGIAVGDVIVMHRDKNFYKHTDELQQYTTQVTGVCITPRTEARGGVSVCVRGLITINVENAAAYTPAAPYTINEYLVLGRVVSRIERDSVPGLPRSERHALRVFVSPELLSRDDAGRATLRWERFLREPTFIAAREAVRTASGDVAADAAVEKAMETIASAVTQEAARTRVRSTGDPATVLAAIASDAKQLLREELEGLKTLNADISQKAKDAVEATINKGGDISGTPRAVGADTTMVRTSLFDKMTTTDIQPDADAIRTLIEWDEVFNTMVASTTTNKEEKAWAMYDVIKATVPTLGASLAKWLSPNGFIARNAKRRYVPVLSDNQANNITTANDWNISKFKYINIDLKPGIETESLASWVNGIYTFEATSGVPEWHHVGWGRNIKLYIDNGFICLKGETSQYAKNGFNFRSVGKEPSFITFFSNSYRCTAFLLNEKRWSLFPIIIAVQKTGKVSQYAAVTTAAKVPDYSTRTRDNYFEEIDFRGLNPTNQNNISEIIECSDFLKRFENYLDTIHVMGIHCCGTILKHASEKLQQLQLLHGTSNCNFVLDDTHNDRLQTFLAYLTLPRDWDNPDGSSIDWLSSVDDENPLGLADVDKMNDFMQPIKVVPTAGRVIVYSTDSIDYTIPLGLYDRNSSGVYHNVADPRVAFTADEHDENYDNIEYTITYNEKIVSTIDITLDSDDEYKPMESHLPMIFDKAVVTSVASKKEQTIRVEYVRDIGQKYVYVSIQDPDQNRIMSSFVLKHVDNATEFDKMVASTYKALSTQSVTLFPDDKNPSEIEAGMLLVYYTQQYLRVVLKDGSNDSIVAMELSAKKKGNTAGKVAKSLVQNKTKYSAANSDPQAETGVHVFYDINVDIPELRLYNLSDDTLTKVVQYSPFNTETIDTIANRELKDDEAIFRAQGVEGTETGGDHKYFNKPFTGLYRMQYCEPGAVAHWLKEWWTEDSQNKFNNKDNIQYTTILPASDNWDALRDRMKSDTSTYELPILPTDKTVKDNILAQLKEGRLFVPIMGPAPNVTAPWSSTDARRRTKGRNVTRNDKRQSHFKAKRSRGGKL